MNPGKIKYQDDQAILDALHAGKMEAFDQVYTMYRSDFLNSASYKFRMIPQEDLVDAWQDTVISFYEQIRSGKIHSLSCSLRGFLFLLGYRYIIKYKRHYLKETSTNQFIEDADSQVTDIELDWEKPLADEKKKLNELIDILPEQTRKMLVLRYIEEKSIEEIKQELGYASSNAVSVSLSRGLVKLRELFMNKSGKTG